MQQSGAILLKKTLTCLINKCLLAVKRASVLLKTFRKLYEIYYNTLIYRHYLLLLLHTFIQSSET